MDASSVSYVAGTSDTPLRYETVGQCLDKATDEYGNRPAVISRHQNIRWNYSELQKEADLLASGFLAMDLKPGERVGLWAPNCAEWVVVQFATAKAGLILVNINPAYRLSELEYALNKVECAALVFASRFKTSNYLEMINSLAPEFAGQFDQSEPSRPKKCEKLPHLRHTIMIGNHSNAGHMTYADVRDFGLAHGPNGVASLGSQLQPDDPINIQFTSGTTGFPKGATLTHHNIVNNGYFVAKRQGFTERDVLCIPVPLYHCFGMVMGVLGCVTHGACMVFPDQAFEAKSVLGAVEAEKCTALFGVPTMFIAELEDPDFANYDLSSLRTGAMAGSPCPVEVMNRVITDMNMSDVTIAYGMTETSPVSLQSMLDDPIEKRVGTVGQIHPFVEVKIIDEDGLTVPRGAQGELCTRGYSVMLGYWNDKDRTHEAIDSSGWMHTGDLASMDAQGYVKITGRLKDMIIRGGENIYPREIEEFLYTHPDIQDVQVFGVPHEKWGEEVCAWILPRGGAGENLDLDQIKAFCEGQIAHYKIPTCTRIVDSYPMTVTGKIQKFVMRDQMIAGTSG